MNEHAPGREALRIGIVGAGLAGLTAARQLTNRAASAGVRCDIVVFEKARGPGGRSATRAADPWRFDHGMQFFTARSDSFRTAVDGWIEQGAVARWTPRRVRFDSADHPPAADPLPPDAEWLVGTPGNNEPCRQLAAGLTLLRRVRIGAIDLTGGRPQLHADALPEEPAGAEAARSMLDEPFDAVLITAPAEQAATLLAPAPSLAAAAGAATLEPCLAAMVGLDGRLDLPWDVASVGGDGPLAWVARDSSKPGRELGGRETWMLHAGSSWSRAQLELDREAAGARLHAAFAELVAGTSPAAAAAVRAAAFVAGHRWRYALASAVADGPCLWDGDLRVGAAGDWCVAPRYESGHLSGVAAADRIAETLGFAGD